MRSDYQYIGNELDVFSLARNWKAYWAKLVRPYLGRRVLEVGAGLGANTELLCSPEQENWVALEPDAALLQQALVRLESHRCRHTIEARSGTIASTSPTRLFDTILYADVLEHIEEDRRELESAAALLHPGGFLIVLAPAHQRLYSAFDHAVGHFRRYSKDTLRAITPPCLELTRMVYLDSAGLLASAANLMWLRQSLPTSRQILFWDRCLVPLSVRADRWLRFSIGKSVIGIWRKRNV